MGAERVKPLSVSGFADARPANPIAGIPVRREGILLLLGEKAGMRAGVKTNFGGAAGTEAKAAAQRRRKGGGREGGRDGRPANHLEKVVKLPKPQPCPPKTTVVWVCRRCVRVVKALLLACRRRVCPKRQSFRCAAAASGC